MGSGALAAQTASISFDIPLRDARDAFERAYFEYHLARENGSMTRVAEKTGLERTHLYRKLKQLGVDLGKNKGEAESRREQAFAHDCYFEICREGLALLLTL